MWYDWLMLVFYDVRVMPQEQEALFIQLGTGRLASKVGCIVSFLRFSLSFARY